jgi:hypothetical protein
LSQYFPGICTEFKDFNLTYDEDGNPKIEDCQKHYFPGYYLTPESMSLFERLYSNETGGLQDKFVAFWKAVAIRFVNNTYVLGYDPINEPFPSNMYMDPSIVYEPGRFDRYTLQPMYKRIF